MTDQLETPSTEDSQVFPPLFNLDMVLKQLVVYRGQDGFQEFLNQYTKALESGGILCHPSLQQDPLLEVSEHHRLVASFMLSAGQSILPYPQRPSDEVLALRAKLQIEETLELIKGLGVTIHVVTSTDSIVLDKDTHLTYTADQPFDAIEVIDGIADNRVICTGTGLACGILVGDTTQREVDINNLYKFRSDSDGHTREDGKWVKPSNHPAPRLELMQGFINMATAEYLQAQIFESEQGERMADGEASNDTLEA